jgi:hypothetical protein
MEARETEMRDGKIVEEVRGNRRMEGIDKDPVTAIKP